MSVKTGISKISINVYQEGNTLGTTDEVEELKIIFEYPLDVKDGAFIVLKSKTGWSSTEFSEVADLVSILEKNIKNIEKDFLK
jgi:hypothetical protein